jgi:hypothetical protein
VARLATNATVMASPMSSIIPGWRARSSLTAPLMNGHPPKKKMTVPRTGEIQSVPAGRP